MELLHNKMNRKFEFGVVILSRINIHDDSNNLKWLNFYRSQYGEHVHGERQAANDNHKNYDLTLCFSLEN